VSVELIEEEPPRHRTQKRVTYMQQWAAEVRKRPGKWFLHPKQYGSYSSASTSFRQFVTRWTREHGLDPDVQYFDFTSRTVDGKGRLYVRYVGPVDLDVED
jgi:hypothetical protein